MDDRERRPSDFFIEPLSAREGDILTLIARGLSNRQIAESLFLAVSTVKWYNRQIYDKLGVQNRREAADRASELDIVDLDIPPARVKNNLPVQMTPFIGRERELDDLAGLIADPDVRLITILAPGGMGKTRLALELAACILNRSARAQDRIPLHSPKFSNGIFFVPLQPLSSPDHIVPTIAEAVGYQFQRDEREPLQQLLDFFRQKQILLLLDNFEHLLDGADIVTMLLQSAPDVKVLVTGREILRLSGEVVYTVDGLNLPTVETSEAMQKAEAVVLFMQRARWADSAIDFDDGTLRDIVRICRLVEGMPLAILLAAAWVRTLPLAEIVTEIEQGLDILEAETRDMPLRHHSMRAVFERTWERLSAEERDMFMWLSVFRGGFTRKTAQVVTSAGLRTLGSLVDKALVQVNPAGRYNMHELVGQYAGEQLERSGQADPARDAHSAYYADYLHTREEDIKGRRQREALDEIQLEIENVGAAWGWAVEKQRLDTIKRMEWGLSLYYIYSSGGFINGLSFFEQVLHLKEDRALHARLMARYGTLLYLMRQYKAAEPWLQQSLVISRETDNKADIAFVLRNLASTVFFSRSDFETANSMIAESISLYEEIGDNWGMGFSLHIQGNMAAIAGVELSKALLIGEKALEMRRAVGDRIGEASTLNLAIGLALHYHGEYQRELQPMQLSLAILREMNISNMTTAFLVVFWGENRVSLGEYAQALQYFNEASAIARENGVLFDFAASLSQAANTLSLMGRYSEALERLEENRAVVQSFEYTEAKCLYLLVRSRVAYRQGDYSAALLHAQESLEGAQAPQSSKLPHLDANHVGLSLLQLGLVEIKLGTHESARRHIHEGLRDVLRKPALFRGVYGIAVLKHAEGRDERAAELTALVHHHRIAEHEFKMYAAELLVELEARLPADVYAEAVERGKTLDLDVTVRELLEEYFTAQGQPFPEPIRTANQALESPLSERELEVLQLLAAGHSNRQIAASLKVKVSTVKKHAYHLYRKLGVENRTQAVLRGQTLKLT